MSEKKPFSQKLSKIYINLGGHAVIIHGGSIEFVAEFPDPNVAIDTLAGALWVEGNQNAASLPELAHTENIDGQTVRVTYGLNGSRHFEQDLASNVINKGVVAGGPDRPIGMNNPDGFVDEDPKGLNTPEAFQRPRATGELGATDRERTADGSDPNVVATAQGADAKAAESFSNPAEVETVPDPPTPSIGPVSAPFDPDAPEKGNNPNAVSPNKPQHLDFPGQNPNTISPNKPQGLDQSGAFSETPGEAANRREKVEDNAGKGKGGKKK